MVFSYLPVDSRCGLQQHYNISIFYTRLTCVNAQPAQPKPSTAPPLPCKTHPAQRPSITLVRKPYGKGPHSTGSKKDFHQEVFGHGSWSRNSLVARTGRQQQLTAVVVVFAHATNKQQTNHHQLNYREGRHPNNQASIALSIASFTA